MYMCVKITLLLLLTSGSPSHPAVSANSLMIDCNHDDDDDDDDNRDDNGDGMHQ